MAMRFIVFSLFSLVTFFPVCFSVCVPSAPEKDESKIKDCFIVQTEIECKKKAKECKWIEHWHNEVVWNEIDISNEEKWDKLLPKTPNPFNKKNYMDMKSEIKKPDAYMTEKLDASIKPQESDGVDLIRINFGKNGKIASAAMLNADSNSIKTYLNEIIKPMSEVKHEKDQKIISTSFDPKHGFFNIEDYKKHTENVEKEHVTKFDLLKSDKIKKTLNIKSHFSSWPISSSGHSGINTQPIIKKSHTMHNIALKNDNNKHPMNNPIERTHSVLIKGHRRRLLAAGDDRRELAGYAVPNPPGHAAPVLNPNIGGLWFEDSGAYHPKCTAWPIANDFLAAAAHCLCEHRTFADWETLRWFPGYNNYEHEPISTGLYHAHVVAQGNLIKTVYLTKAWITAGCQGVEDWVVFELKANHAAPNNFRITATQLKWFVNWRNLPNPYTVPVPGANNIINIYTAGYPAILRYAQVSDINTIAQQYQTTDGRGNGILRTIEAGGPGCEWNHRENNHEWFLNHDLATAGQSGSPYITLNNGHAIGVVAKGETHNSGPEITPKRFNTICYILSKTYWFNPICAVYYRGLLGAQFVPLQYQRFYYLNEGYYGNFGHGQAMAKVNLDSYNNYLRMDDDHYRYNNRKQENIQNYHLEHYNNNNNKEEEYDEVSDDIYSKQLLYLIFAVMGSSLLCGCLFACIGIFIGFGVYKIMQKKSFQAPQIVDTV